MFQSHGRSNTGAWVLCLLFTAVFSFVGWLKYRSFNFIDFDLAQHAQIMWALTHGSIHSSILGIPFLGNHAHLILFLLAPFYALFPHPLTLIFLQAAACAAGGFLLYRFASRHLPSSVSLALLASYLFYPALGYTNLFEFHPSVLAIPFVFLALIGLYENGSRRFIAGCLLACLCQENLPLVIAPMGLYAIFLKRPWPWRIWPIVGAGIYFFLVNFWLIPKMGGNVIDFWVIYRRLGNTPGQIIFKVLADPMLWFRTFFQAKALVYWMMLLAPVMFLPILRPLPLLLFCLPSFLQHFLSIRPAEQTIYFHYTAEMIPGIFLSAILGMERLLASNGFPSKFAKKFANPRKIAVSLAVGVVGINFLFGPQTWLPFRIREFQRKAGDEARDQLLKIIPPGAGVAATFDLLPKLANRSHLYSFHHWWTGFYTLSRRAYLLPANAQWAIIDLDDPLLFHDLDYLPGFADLVSGPSGFHVSDANARFNALLGPGAGWTPVAHRDSVIVFKRLEKPAPVPPCPRQLHKA